VKRKLLLIAATILLCLGVITIRAMWEGRSALQRGDEAQASGDSEAAVRWWRRAARWYVPMAPHVASAYDRLQSLAEAAEGKGDTQVALAAWTGIRSSIRATRSFYTPFSERVDEADEHIAALMVQREQAEGTSRDPKERQEWHYALLKLDPMPSVFWSLVALLGLALWIGGGFVFAMRAVDDKDRLVPKAAAYSGAGIAIGLVIWLTGLHLA
jgi:hypothetical protein